MLCVHSDGLLMLTLTGALHDACNSSVEEQAFIGLVFHLIALHSVICLYLDVKAQLNGVQ